MDRRQADIVMGDLARAIGIPGLVLDERGFGVLAIDEGRVIVGVGHNAGAGSIDLMTCLDTVDPTPGRIARALAGNFSVDLDGPVLAAEPSTGAFVLQQRLVHADLPGDGFPGVVTRFVEQAEAWTARLAEIGDEPTSPSSGSEEPTSPNPGVRA